MEYESDAIDVLRNEIDKLDCTCQTTKIRYKKTVDNRILYCKQCVKCGSRMGEWIPHADIPNPDSIMPFNNDLRGYYVDSRNELRSALLERQKAKEYSEFTEARMEAMNTQHWQTCKIAVKKRCGGICEGCGNNQIVDVHHKTYRNLGDEFLFELIGLCRECHNRYHKEEE